MSRRREKLVSLQTAAASVTDGARVAFGGFGVYCRPMAFARELLRQGRRDLTVVGHVNALEVDILAATGALACVETSYVGLERHGIAPHFARAVEAGRVRFAPYSELLAFDRFRANQAGLTFWPAYHLANTDILEASPEIVAAICPLTGRAYHAVPPADPDVVVLHAGRADRFGNVEIPAERQASHSLDIILSQSCRSVIVTAEEIVETSELSRTPQLVEIPAFTTTMVAHAPGGAHPCSMLGYYGRDDECFARYVVDARASTDARAHVRQWCGASEDAYQQAIPEGTA